MPHGAIVANATRKRSCVRDQLALPLVPQAREMLPSFPDSEGGSERVAEPSTPHARLMGCLIKHNTQQWQEFHGDILTGKGDRNPEYCPISGLISMQPI